MSHSISAHIRGDGQAVVTMHRWVATGRGETEHWEMVAQRVVAQGRETQAAIDLAHEFVGPQYTPVWKGAGWGVEWSSCAPLFRCG